MSQIDDWVYNYYNYFTEIEEHFQKARGTSLFRLSTLDWALAGSWKEAGVPLEAVLRGIDAAFEKWRARQSKTQMINSLAFCAQAVMMEAQIMAGAAPAAKAKQSAPPFPIEDLRRYFARNSGALRKQTHPAYHEIAAALDRLAAEADRHYERLEDLERHLSALEDKMIATARSMQTEDELLAARRELDFQLRPYRGKMTAAQLAMLEKQYLERSLLERAGLPRLSLFYLRE